MKATCPICGNYGPLENFLAQEDYKRALAELLSLPGDLPRQTVKYLALFRKPGSDRALTGPRVLKIIEELKGLVMSEQIQWKGGRIYANKATYWSQAIQAMLDRESQGKLERPLDGHNYLRSVAYSLAEKSFEQAHREKEKSRSHRPDIQPEQRKIARTDTDDQPAPEPLDWESQLAKIREVQAKLREG